MDLPESNGFFVTGTDTGVGKTVFTVALIENLKSEGKTVIGMKPVAAGCEKVEGQWVNDDAMFLKKHGSVELPYCEINPYALKKPVSPHLAAAEDGVRVSLENLEKQAAVLAKQSDCLVVEGAGGWEVPLNDEEKISDLAVRLDYPVILVVGLKLGCINHALLSVEAIRQRGVECVGWVANQIDPHMLCQEENIETLKRQIDCPMLTYIPFDKALADQAAL